MESVNGHADVVVIGGGPAGISAAVWSQELGLSTALFEKGSELGGQLLYTFNSIDNYLGIAASDGRDLMKHFEQSVQRSGFRRITGCEVTDVDTQSRRLSLRDGGTFGWRALIVATGVRRRELSVPGASEFAGRGILQSGVRARETVRGKRVMIVGGGDAAIENALMLSETAAVIKVAVRGSRPRAREEFIAAVAGRSNIEILTETTVSEIAGDSVVTSVGLNNAHGRWIEPVDAVLIRIGVVPNSDLFQATLEVDDESYIKTNAVGQTSTANIYAIGDVANPIAPTISAASGSGAIAAKAIYRALQSKKAL